MSGPRPRSFIDQRGRVGCRVRASIAATRGVRAWTSRLTALDGGMTDTRDPRGIVNFFIRYWCSTRSSCSVSLSPMSPIFFLFNFFRFHRLHLLPDVDSHPPESSTRLQPSARAPSGRGGPKGGEFFGGLQRELVGHMVAFHFLLPSSATYLPDPQRTTTCLAPLSVPPLCWKPKTSRAPKTEVDTPRPPPGLPKPTPTSSGPPSRERLRHSLPR